MQIILHNLYQILLHSLIGQKRIFDVTNLQFSIPDCFERIALGAMLPFEKTFRNSDTNSLKICESLCLNDKECQTFAFGISGRGNGTCQLSAKVIDATNSRPVGTIFDPDFDLYARKYNCFTDAGPGSQQPSKPSGGLFEQKN